MKAKSTIAPPKFKLGDSKDNLIEVIFYCDIEEVREEETTMYEYSVFKLKTTLRDDLEKIIEKEYDNWLELAKDNDYHKLANDVREKRNQLLNESDEHVLLDRIGLDIPTDITLANLFNVVKDFFDNFKDILSGDWTKYRQELRDITKQKNFPYDVKFPKKPTDKGE